MRIRFPIRYKFLFVTTALLIFSVTAYLSLASQIFKRDKIELIFDLNRGAVSGLASDIHTLFQSVGDKMRLAAILSHETQTSAPNSESAKRSNFLLEDILQNGSDVVFLSASYGFQRLDQVVYVDENYATTYGVNQSYFKETLPDQRQIPFAEIQAEGEAIWNATLPNGPPLVGFAKTVVPEIGSESSGKSGPAPFAMIAFVRVDKILKSFADLRLNEVIATNRHGQILIHPDIKKMTDPFTNTESMQSHPLYQAAKAQSVSVGVLKYQTDKNQEMLGAHASSFGGRILVLSQINGEQAFSAVGRLVQNTIVFAFIAITLAFLAAVFFSRSLTKPIQLLTETMGRVSKGELETSIELKTHDEIALLATSFNAMVKDLKTSHEKLADVNRDLENKVRDRTARLEEQNLAVKKAQEALLQTTRLATVGEVAGRAAHEVLNPLTSIVTRLERVRQRLQTGAGQEVQLVQHIVESWESDMAHGGFEKLVENWQAPSSINQSASLWQEDIENLKLMESTVRGELASLLQDVEFIMKESQRINRIVQNMRELTRPKGDLQVLSTQSLTREAVKIMMDLANHKQIQIVESLNAENDHARLDADEYIQCLTNLLRNSIQAIETRRQQDPLAPNGVIEVTLSNHEDSLQVDIIDNGIGMTASDKAKLFEVHFTTKPPSEGTGLGLSISRRFIRAFGGDLVLLQSSELEGCHFRITLPLASPKSLVTIEKVAV